MYISGLPNLVVSTSAGDTYAVASGQSRVHQEQDLPAQLPAEAHGTMCQVGTASAETAWYQYSHVHPHLV